MNFDLFLTFWLLLYQRRTESGRCEVGSSNSNEAGGSTQPSQTSGSRHTKLNAVRGQCIGRS